MEKNNLKKGVYYCNMDGVYKFRSNGLLGSKPVSAFWACDYNEDTEQYEETTRPVFMDEEQVTTLTYL